MPAEHLAWTRSDAVIDLKDSLTDRRGLTCLDIAIEVPRDISLQSHVREGPESLPFIS